MTMRTIARLSTLDDSLIAPTPAVSHYLSESIAAGTRRTYQSCWRNFCAWSQHENRESLPASVDTIAAYLAHRADSGAKSATIDCDRAAIAKFHVGSNYQDPTNGEAITALLSGIHRAMGTAQTAKRAILPAELRLMIESVDLFTLAGVRDKAILLLAFFTASRRSELAALQLEDLEFSDDGLLVTIRRSKTDQTGNGMTKGVTRRSGVLCPVQAVENLIQSAGIISGPLFREIAKSGRMLNNQLTGDSIARIIKKYARLAGMDESLYSGHSARRGFVTSAFDAGASVDEVRAVTKHQDVRTLFRYKEDSDLLRNNAGAKIDI